MANELRYEKGAGACEIHISTYQITVITTIFLFPSIRWQNSFSMTKQKKITALKNEMKMWRDIRLYALNRYLNTQYAFIFFSVVFVSYVPEFIKTNSHFMGRIEKISVKHAMFRFIWMWQLSRNSKKWLWNPDGNT